ncbi:unnamed protein product [Thelazia callipaeda]|uniref:Ribosomal_L12 domain-containing protein n=1 Tax=Thelazia callipaeda TaxID=103827 RepID=A0A0N5D7K5_THECL|nr:unnamed protein product [Thelazia callipaeda]
MKQFKKSLVSGSPAHASLSSEKATSKLSKTEIAGSTFTEAENIDASSNSENVQSLGQSESSRNSTISQIPVEPGKASPLPPCDGERVVSERVLRLANEITNLTIFEVAELNSTLKKKLNLPDTPVFASHLTTSIPATVEDGSGMEKNEPQQSQKTFFSVKLTKLDDSKKIPLIKEIRTIMEGFNLVQAKKFVEALPATVKDDLSKSEAEELKAKLEKLGAVCEIV